MSAAVQVTRPARSRSDYLPTVCTFMPGIEEKEAGLRCSILLLRDNSSSTLRRCNAEAAAVLQVVERLSTAYAFHPMPQRALEHFRYQLHRLVMAASGLETFGALLIPKEPSDA